MNFEVLLYILLAMIAWDFSLHVIELMGKSDKLIKSKSFLSYYYPHFRWRKAAKKPVEREGWYVIYQRFWVTYWGVALIILALYIIKNN